MTFLSRSMFCLLPNYRVFSIFLIRDSKLIEIDVTHHFASIFVIIRNSIFFDVNDIICYNINFFYSNILFIICTLLICTFFTIELFVYYYNLQSFDNWIIHLTVTNLCNNFYYYKIEFMLNYCFILI